MKNKLSYKEEITIRNNIDGTFLVTFIAFVQFWSVIIGIGSGLWYNFVHTDYKRSMLVTICICVFLFIAFGLVYYRIISKAMKYYEELKEKDRIQFRIEFEEMRRNE